MGAEHTYSKGRILLNNKSQLHSFKIISLLQNLTKSTSFPFSLTFLLLNRIFQIKIFAFGPANLLQAQ